MPGNYATLGQTSVGSYDDPKKKKAAAPAPVAAPVMAASAAIKPPAAASAPTEPAIPRAKVVQSDQPSRSTLVAAGKVATPESTQRAIAYDKSEPAPKLAPEMSDDDKKAMAAKVVVDKTTKTTDAQGREVPKVMIDGKEIPKAKPVEGATRINRMTGLPFGYRPGDALPADVAESSKAAAQASVNRMNEATKMAANTRPSKTPIDTTGSLARRDASVTASKAKAQADYEARQKQGAANKAAWDAGDKTLKAAGVKMVSAPPSYDWAHKAGAKEPIPKESRSEQRNLKKFYNDNPGIQSDSAEKWRDGKPFADEGGNKDRMEKLMEKRKSPMRKHKR